MSSKYRAYIKDNPEGYWFKRKLYGWGWTPATWQGWLITLGFAGVMLLNIFRLDGANLTDEQAIKQILLPTLLLVLALIVVCYKTGESPKWTWGPPKEEDGIKNE